MRRSIDAVAGIVHVFFVVAVDVDVLEMQMGVTFATKQRDGSVRTVKSRGRVEGHGCTR